VKAPQSGSRKRSSGHTKQRSIALHGRKTNVTLEDEFWRAFREIAAKEGCSAAELATRVLYTRTDKNLSSALRVFVLEHFRASPGDAG
jgi:predicted DNA-binding ribbon-helix-helix protein